VLTYRRFEQSEAERLVAFLTLQTWPYHVFEKPTESQILTNLEAGVYDGPSNRTFWVEDGPVDLDRTGGHAVALIRLEELDSGTPMFDLRVAAGDRGRGVGGQALVWLTDYLFTEFSRISRIEGQTRQDNIAMRRALRRQGYQKEAHYREAWPGSDGTAYDAIGYGMLRRDWFSGTRTPVQWEDETTA
jgi:RimJ/RimL family protein N-acetyltransferase